MSGTDVSTHPTNGTLGTPLEGGLADEGEGPPDAAATPTSEGWQPEGPAPRNPVARALRGIGFHLAVIAGFTVPAVALWWHVWSGHPASTLTCGCGDPAQQVWFTEWPAWAMANLHGLFFTGAVNVPNGANLLSNTSGLLVGVLLAPVTVLFGPVASTNVALTLAPALSAWGCFVAIRPLVTWKPIAIPAALIYGYSAAIVSSLVFGHVSVTVLVIPPLLFTTFHEIVIGQAHSVRRDGLVLAALLIAQFFISPEIFVISLLFVAVGLVAAIVFGWRQVGPRAGHALPALGLAAGLVVVVLTYPAWYGLAGPQSVTGVLFAIAPLTGVSLAGLWNPGSYSAFANNLVRFGGYLGRNGPPPDYVGGGVVLAAVASVVLGRRRPLTWLLALLLVVSLWLSLGALLIGGPTWLSHIWLPWAQLSRLPVLKEILPDQIAPFIALFAAFLIAVGVDAFVAAHRRGDSWLALHRRSVGAGVTVLVALIALVPVFVTFNVPFRVVAAGVPPYVRDVADSLPESTVLLTVPFAVTGSSPPMFWQAAGGMHFRLAGAALKTPDATGGPVGTGTPGSARRILTNLSLAGAPAPVGTPAQFTAVRAAFVRWHVDQVVIAGASRDPVYASGFLTMAIGSAPVYVDRAWVWDLPRGGPATTPATGASLATCRAAAAAPSAQATPLFMADCVLMGRGRS
jgi:hypothetical protein